MSGIGMSDWDVYAQEFSRIFKYTNTFFHSDPFLDITSNDSAAMYSDLDFVICSEVLEHVLPPVSAALQNIFGMLKPGGTLILSVPSLEGYETIEHYPHISEFSIINEGNEYVVLNTRPDGHSERHTHPIFHGGPGSVLEFRVFGEGDILSMLRHVGFSVTRLEFDESIGYFWKLLCENALWRGRCQRSHILICDRPYQS
jgi:SAM-dependent methyltransferase